MMSFRAERSLPGVVLGSPSGTKCDKRPTLRDLEQRRRVINNPTPVLATEQLLSVAGHRYVLLSAQSRSAVTRYCAFTKGIYGRPYSRDKLDNRSYDANRRNIKKKKKRLPSIKQSSGGDKSHGDYDVGRQYVYVRSWSEPTVNTTLKPLREKEVRWRLSKNLGQQSSIDPFGHAARTLSLGGGSQSRLLLQHTETVHACQGETRIRLCSRNMTDKRDWERSLIDGLNVQMSR